MKKLLLLSLSVLFTSLNLISQNSWQQVNTSMIEAFESVYITSSGTIFITSEQGNIYRSNDAGLTWIATTTNVVDGIADISFASPSQALAVGDDGLILSSIDSGTTWNPVASGVSSNLEAIFHIDSDTAYIAGRDGSILKSTNGGASWSPLSSGTTERLEDVVFTSASTGFVAGREGVFLKTTNYGSTWTNINLGSDDNNSIFFLNATTGFMGGENGIFKTTDGGNTWSPVNILGGIEPNALHFGSSSHGYAVGELGEISRSIDGGNNWVPDTSIGFAELNDVFFIDGQNGMAVGDGGSILRRIGAGGSNPSSFCQASYWVDSINSGGSHLYVVNNSIPSNSDSSYTTSYLWSFGDGDTSTKPYPVHTYANSGAYQLCLTIMSINFNGDTCVDMYCDSLGLDSLGNLVYKSQLAGFTLNVVDSSSIGLHENRLTPVVEIYPNPAHEVLKVEFPKEWQSAEIQVLSLTGQKVLSQVIQSDDIINISGIPKGAYLLRVNGSDNKTEIKAFVRN